MKVFCCQLNIVWENKPANHAKVHKLLAEAKAPAGSMVLLPEMFATGFSMNISALAEPATLGQSQMSQGAVSGETNSFLSRTAREFGIYLVGGLITTTKDGRGHNESAIFSPEGKEIVRYNKCQPFTLGGEAQHYEAGKQIITFNWQGCVVAPFICYDLRFPELFREGVRQGAQLFVVIANWPVKRIQHWVTLLQARAIENQAYVAGVNRTGTDPTLTYNGRSVIVSPHGEILADAGESEGMISAEVGLAGVEAWRAEFPALQDMRVGQAWRDSASNR